MKREHLLDELRLKKDNAMSAINDLLSHNLKLIIEMEEWVSLLQSGKIKTHEVTTTGFSDTTEKSIEYSMRQIKELRSFISAYEGITRE